MCRLIGRINQDQFTRGMSDSRRNDSLLIKERVGGAR